MPLYDEVKRVLQCLRDGLPVGETERIDFKEEAGRRGQGGAILPGSATNEKAAQALAAESACMANSDGGGALIVGVADKDRALIGTQLEIEWLRHRIYQLTDQRLTVSVREESVEGARLLVLFIPQAIEPIRYNGKLKWRVADHCVDIDPTSWYARRKPYDWSASPSDTPTNQAREAAIEIARDFLSSSNEPAAQNLAEATTGELLRRLNATTADGYLTEAGKLLFVGRATPSLDYIRRDYSGGDSTDRVRRTDRSVIEQLAEVFINARANNPVQHLSRGLPSGQLRELPESAIREAIVNGVAHRDWNSPEPTVIEHVGRTLRVTSPGGFVSGVNENNIITHPSKSRNTALTELLAALRIAEREGIGVDRMVGDMLRRGQPQPEIREIDGPSVVAGLVGNMIDQAWMSWLELFGDPSVRNDLRLLMLTQHVVRHGWVDKSTAGRLLQLSPLETVDALNELTDKRVGGQWLLRDVEGTPAGADLAYALTDGAWGVLERIDAEFGQQREWPDRRTIALDYARHRGRISTTELGSIVNAHSTNVGSVLKGLEKEGLLAPSRESRRGAGFYYVYVS
ncbi:ATP-binding protein [Nocardia sp. NPDC050717]|uniref:ATP-binding protein n=1 Tax=Nocardia sp. NPDC050717 TaxID=3157221 RepID=UPI0033E17221